MNNTSLIWVVALCNLVGGYQPFGEVFCLRFQGRRHNMFLVTQKGNRLHLEYLHTVSHYTAETVGYRSTYYYSVYIFIIKIYLSYG
jgi:hypothetical protein